MCVCVCVYNQECQYHVYNSQYNLSDIPSSHFSKNNLIIIPTPVLKYCTLE